jgi:peptidoglycan/LPS O-acetylase OafA/YrhL
MNASVGQTVVRILLAIVVVLAAGFWGLIVLFSDLPPQQSRAIWFLYLTAGHFLAGFLVGFLLPLRWRFSVAVAWGTVMVSLLGLLSVARRPQSGTTDGVPLSGGIALTVFALLMLPATAMGGGYAGSLLGRKWPRNSTKLRAAPGAAKAS